MTECKRLGQCCVRSIPLVKLYCADASDYPMNNPGRHHHGLLYTLVGGEVYHFTDCTLRTAPGTVLYIPDSEMYSITLQEGVSEVVCIDFDIAEDAPDSPFLVRLGEKNEIRELFLDAVDSWQHHSEARSPTMRAKLYRIFARLITQESTYTGSVASRKIHDALTYLYAHVSDPTLRVEDVARRAGISRRYFEKLFWNEHGATPRDYILARRMELAREMLFNERLSVTDVAALVGYTDLYHFSRIFKEKCGLSPTAYKRQMRTRGRKNAENP